jgi:cobalt-zinc-cadmium resistance protein CzcA
MSPPTRCRPTVADNYIMLKPPEEWPDPDKTKAELLAELEAAVAKVPGNNYEFTQPIQMRFNELISGVRSMWRSRCYGDDMDVLNSTAEQIAKVLQAIPGRPKMSRSSRPPACPC